VDYLRLITIYFDKLRCEVLDSTRRSLYDVIGALELSADSEIDEDDVVVLIQHYIFGFNIPMAQLSINMTTVEC
jgi:hypothetical protein